MSRLDGILVLVFIPSQATISIESPLELPLCLCYVMHFVYTVYGNGLDVYNNELICQLVFIFTSK